jgi:DNA mismatch repair ATPase MutS
MDHLLFTYKSFSFFKDVMNNYSAKQVGLFMALISGFFTNIFPHIKQDLELDKIFNVIDRTRTIQGKIALQELLANPTTDIVALQDRQSVIAHLCDDGCVHKKLIEALECFSKNELGFSNACGQTSAIDNASLQGFYFSSENFKKWNTSPLGLELGQLAHCANLMGSTIQHGLTWAILLGIGEESTCVGCPLDHGGHDVHHAHKHKHDGEKKKHHHNHDRHDHKHHHEKKKHDHGHTCEKKECKHKHGHDHSHEESPARKNLKKALSVWHTFAIGQELYGVCTTICNELNIIKQVQKQLMAVAQSIRSMKSIHALLDNHSEITSHLRNYHHIDALCMRTNISEKLDNLLELLEKNTFKGRPSMLSRTGNILAAYKLLQEVGEELQPALAAIGDLDACSSCAQLMMEHQAGPLRYSFAQYETENVNPHIQIQNFWHPLVSASEVTLNSLSLGVDGYPRNALLTGPNACGKSTNLKSATLCIYLAQTLAIVPADRHCQTVFKEIFSSMVIADQLQQGKSLFVTELENARELLERVEKLAPNECVFVALDELFKSTQHEKGQNVAYQLLKKLHNCPQIITVITTHFEKLTHLGQRNISTCANYTVKDFKLTPGIGAFDDTGSDDYFFTAP